MKHVIALQAPAAPEPSEPSGRASGPPGPSGLPAPSGLQAASAEQASDLSLVVAAQRDPAAFDAIYARYLTRLYRYVRAFIWNDEDAADVTQLVFLKAFEALPLYEARGAPFAVWLFRIARNTSVDARRRRRTHGAAPDTQSDAVLARLAAPDDPEQTAIQQETLTRLRELIATLDEFPRQLLALRFAGGLSATEIAEVVGKKPEAVKKRMTRTLQALKEQFHDPQPSR